MSWAPLAWSLPDEPVACAAPAAKPCGGATAVSHVDAPGRQEAVVHRVPVCAMHLDPDKWSET